MTCGMRGPPWRRACIRRRRSTRGVAGIRTQACGRAPAMTKPPQRRPSIAMNWTGDSRDQVPKACSKLAHTHIRPCGVSTRLGRRRWYLVMRASNPTRRRCRRKGSSCWKKGKARLMLGHFAFDLPHADTAFRTPPRPARNAKLGKNHWTACLDEVLAAPLQKAKMEEKRNILAAPAAELRKALEAGTPSSC